MNFGNIKEDAHGKMVLANQVKYFWYIFTCTVLFSATNWIIMFFGTIHQFCSLFIQEIVSTEIIWPCASIRNIIERVFSRS